MMSLEAKPTTLCTDKLDFSLLIGNAIWDICIMVLILVFIY